MAYEPSSVGLHESLECREQDAAEARGGYGINVGRACRLVRHTRSIKDPQTALRQRMQEIARTRDWYA